MTSSKYKDYFPVVFLLHIIFFHFKKQKKRIVRKSFRPISWKLYRFDWFIFDQNPSVQFIFNFLEKLYYCNILTLKDSILFSGSWSFGSTITWASNSWASVIFCLCISTLHKTNLKKKNHKFILKYLYYSNLLLNIIKWIFLAENWSRNGYSIRTPCVFKIYYNKLLI